MAQTVHKAVIPAAGFGTRMLPFTKAVPKELIPLVDKPVIQYVVEEAIASGLDEILLILSSGKEAVLKHFQAAPELETRLKETGKVELLTQITSIGKGAKISCVYQEELDGLGGAVKLAEEFCAGEYFALLLGDTVLDSSNGIPVTKQLIDAYHAVNTSVIAVEQLPLNNISSYGNVGGSWKSENILQINAMVEKPAETEVLSDLAVASRYLLSPDIFPLLRQTPRGKGNELQLTDAIKQLIPSGALHGCRIDGKRYDLGSKAGFLAANIEFALRDAGLSSAIGKKLAAANCNFAASISKMKE